MYGCFKERKRSGYQEQLTPEFVGQSYYKTPKHERRVSVKASIPVARCAK